MSIIIGEIGPLGLLRDYGYDDYDHLFPANDIVLDQLKEAALEGSNYTISIGPGYSVDGYYALNFPELAAYNATRVKALAKNYQDTLGTKYIVYLTSFCPTHIQDS